MKSYEQVDVTTITDGLGRIIRTIESYHGRAPRLDDPEILASELEFRQKARAAFQAWLAQPDWQAAQGGQKDAIKAFGLYRFEQAELEMCFLEPTNDDRLRKLWEYLKSLSTNDPQPKEAIAKVFRTLEELQAGVQQSHNTRMGVAKWTVATALLAYTHDGYPFIRPSSTGSESGLIATEMFRGLPWISKVDATRFEEYFKRYEMIQKAVMDVFHLSELPSLSDVSAWMVAVHRMLKEPEESELLRRLAESQPTILQGPPGTGKTHRVERLAQKLKEGAKPVPVDQFDGSPDQVVVEMVQFHASYDYEDFVRGFRPQVTDQGIGFELRDGPFARMVSLALRYPESKFLLLVDEINRADLARVLGECIYLLDRPIPHQSSSTDGASVESVWKGQHPGAISLRYSPSKPAQTLGEYDAERLLPKLIIPTNFLLLGTMNTADRSIAVVDVALRRRFAFLDIRPEPAIVRSHGKDKTNRERYAQWMEMLNGSEDQDGLIEDSRFHIGHSYFLGDSKTVRMSIRYKLLPLLEEYVHERRFRADDSEVNRFLEELRNHHQP